MKNFICLPLLTLCTFSFWIASSSTASAQTAPTAAPKSQETVASLTAKIKANPKSPNLYLMRARLQHQAGEFKKAIVDYNGASMLDAKWPTPVAYRGLVYADLEKPELAIADFSKAIQMQPKWATPYGYRAEVYEFQEQYKKAIADHSAVIRLTPKSPQSYVLRGDCYTRMGDDHKAILDYSQAIALAPKWIIAYSSRADAWHNLKQYDKALADYQAAVRAVPENPACYEELSWFLATCPDARYRNGQRALQNAMKACKMIGMDKIDCVSMDMLAAAYATAGQFREAIAWQKKAILCDPAKSNEFTKRLKRYESGKIFLETVIK